LGGRRFNRCASLSGAATGPRFCRARGASCLWWRATPYLSKLVTINIGRRGFIRVVTGAAAGMASGPFLIRRAHAQSKQPLVILYGVPRATMDAQNHINTYDESPLGNMFENLVDMSNPIDPYKGWRPMLAVSWKRLNETTFQFRLRENVKFHNGEPFDAEAVKFSVDRLLGRVDKSFLPPTVAWHAYDTINRAEPVDRYTVNVITKVPDPIVLNRFNGFGCAWCRRSSTANTRPPTCRTTPTGPDPTAW
jgi:ABC-type transport system substrate-binding protein